MSEIVLLSWTHIEIKQVTFKKGSQVLHSIIILGAWSLWIFATGVFFMAIPNLARFLLLTNEELQFWEIAGAQGVNSLLAKGMNVD